MRPPDVCRSCGAEIRWVLTHATGARMPLDYKPESRLVIGRSGRAHVVETYTSHFATCPQAGLWSGEKR